MSSQALVQSYLIILSMQIQTALGRGGERDETEEGRKIRNKYADDICDAHINLSYTFDISTATAELSIWKCGCCEYNQC